MNEYSCGGQVRTHRAPRKAQESGPIRQGLPQSIIEKVSGNKFDEFTSYGCRFEVCWRTRRSGAPFFLERNKRATCSISCPPLSPERVRFGMFLSPCGSAR